MRSTCLWLLTCLLFGVNALGGCGGDSKSGDGSGAAGSGGSGGNAATAGTAHGGSGTSGSSAGESGSGGSSLGDCAKADCGPQLGIPNWTCADGTVGGPTGRCLRLASGTCGWEINNCPMGGAGAGGTSSQGGSANTAGDAAVGGAAGAGGALPEGCGGCSPGTVCVLQLGGPGPSHFLCAMQNPCGAAGACACIVGQGKCQPNLMGDPPSYCSCDNGLQ